MRALKCSLFRQGRILSHLTENRERCSFHDKTDQGCVAQVTIESDHLLPNQWIQFDAATTGDEPFQMYDLKEPKSRYALFPDIEPRK
jgi:hypothetical protein